jgi:hypothetical protein
MKIPSYLAHCEAPRRDLAHQGDNLITGPPRPTPERNAEKWFRSIFRTDHFKTMAAKAKAATGFKENAALPDFILQKLQSASARRKSSVDSSSIGVFQYLKLEVFSSM